MQPWLAQLTGLRCLTRLQIFVPNSLAPKEKALRVQGFGK